MNVTALVLSGGKGLRLRMQTEKPLVKIGCKPMIQHVIEAIRESKNVSRIIVATTGNTPQTAQKAKELSVEVIETVGEGFIPDVQQAVKLLGLGTVLTISADLPLITGEIIDEVVRHFEGCGKPSLAVMVPSDVYGELGLKPEVQFELEGQTVVPAGVNIINGKYIDEPEIPQHNLTLRRVELALNVNTTEDLEIANRIISKNRNCQIVLRQ